MISNLHLPQIPKKPIDRLLERLRFNKARTYIPKGTRLLDIGTGDGRVIFTVPHPFVDKSLDVLKFCRIINGLSLEEHHGFNPEVLPDIFNRWKLCKKERWELGCNYLFVFETSL